MIYNSFIHADGNATTDVFRSNVVQFVNDKETHPIVKYKGFVLALLLVLSGFIILLLFNHDKLLGHSFWKHLFIPVSELKDKYLRLQAEFDNYKKRNAKERMDLMMTANKETVVSMLEVLDDADRAETQMKDSDDVAAIKEGINLVFGKLRKTLENKGVKALESKGMDFDVELHEAITEVPMPGQEGKVIDEVVKGYYLNEKLIRYAKVVIGN